MQKPMVAASIAMDDKNTPTQYIIWWDVPEELARGIFLPQDAWQPQGGMQHIKFFNRNSNESTFDKR